MEGKVEFFIHRIERRNNLSKLRIRRGLFSGKSWLLYYYLVQVKNLLVNIVFIKKPEFISKDFYHINKMKSHLFDKFENQCPA